MANSSIETLINKLLKEQDLWIAADELLKKWSIGEFTYAEKTEVGLFLIHAGLHTTLKNQILQDLIQNKELSWPVICRLMQKYPAIFSEEFVNPIMVGLLETDHINEILKSGDFIKLHPRFDSLYEKLISEKSKALGINYLQLKNILKQKELDALLEEKNKISLQDKKMFLTTYIQNAKKNPTIAYDLAVSLAQMEEFASALECLEFAPASPSKDWLYLDLLVESKQYIEAVEQSFKIEKKFSSEPDTVVETLIYRSRSYYGLNEKDKAISILQTICDNYPKYQKARVLLESWSLD